jgi:hypothetical protein
MTVHTRPGLLARQWDEAGRRKRQSMRHHSQFYENRSALDHTKHTNAARPRCVNVAAHRTTVRRRILVESSKTYRRNCVQIANDLIQSSMTAG